MYRIVKTKLRINFIDNELKSDRDFCSSDNDGDFLIP